MKEYDTTFKNMNESLRVLCELSKITECTQWDSTYSKPRRSRLRETIIKGKITEKNKEINYHEREEGL